MDIVPMEKFFSWARGRGIVPDAPGPEASWLWYGEGVGDARFWVVPERAAGIPHFIEHILRGLDAWRECYVWPRMGAWVDDRDHANTKDRVCAGILMGVGVPLGERCALRFAVDELDELATLVFVRIVFGWSVPDDLFIIPDHGQQIVQTDHHDVVHVTLREASKVKPFVEHMRSEEYELPDEPPDGTFKTPDWME